jgi:RHS repeat-associated protein
MALPVALADGSGWGPVSNSTVSIGGDQFSVDPREGALNYGYTFFQGNVNYGQTPFSLALQYQQGAAGTYVGTFTDSNSHAHPFGASAYLPTALPETTQPNSGNNDDAGGVWDLNLPVLFINTAYASDFYGSHAGSNDSDTHPYVTAALNLGDTTYQYLTPMAWFSTDTVSPVPWDVWSQSFVGHARPLYSKDTAFLTIQVFNLADLGSGDPATGKQQGILVQDKDGTTYYFAPAVLYGWEGHNVYKPSYSPNNNSTTPKMDQVFVYRIARIVYPTGLFLNFTYTDDFSHNTSHTVSITGTDGKAIAEVAYNASVGTVKVADATDTLQDLYQINFTGADFRVKSIVNLSNSRQVEYSYVTNQSVPYVWNNQTVLSSITNKYTGYTTAIAYQQFNAHVYDAGCNKFLLGQVAVDTVKNYDNNGTEISKASYDFGFSDDSKSNFIIPQKSGDKTYGSGLAHWLDALYYHENHDSSGCSSSDTVKPTGLTYGTTITTTYPNADRNRTQTLVYDAYGRTQSEAVTASGGWNSSQPITLTSYSYAQTPDQLQALGTYSALPMAFASPASTASGMNFCTLNGSLLSNPTDTHGCMINPTQSWVYDAAGNPTQETSRLGQLTEYSYLPASQTNPPNERLAVTSKLHSIGLAGASYVLQTQQFQTIAVAPAAGSLPGALTQMTLPVSNTEVHFDANQSSTYTYRTDTMGGYVTGNTAQPVLNGILTQRTQQDNTGVSDVVSLTTQYAPTMTTAAGGQGVLAVTSTLTGQAQGGIGGYRNRGGAQISSMGYPIAETDGLGRTTTHAYDAYGRSVAQTYLPGTSYQQASATTYDDALSFTPQPIDNQAAAATLFSVRTTDPYGNVTIKTYDARQRQTGTFEQRVGSAMVQTDGYRYESSSDDRLATAVRYGDGWQKQEDYYYAHGAALQVATVPDVGLADGKLIDGINGNTLTFKYAPGATPTTIGTIYGPVKIVHAGLLNHLVLAEAQIDAGAATAALAGVDLANLFAGGGMVTDDYNLWTSSGNGIPAILDPLYTAIGNLPGNSITPGNADNLLEYTSYGYDEWNRQVSSTLYTFFNAGTDPNNAAQVLSKTTTARTYNTGQRAVTITYPQGQQETRTYNLLSGLQSAQLAVNYAVTDLGRLIHDGLGRVVQYDDTLNGGTSTATYAAGTGLLTTATDAYGNQAAYTYDPSSFLPTQTVLTPAAGGAAITVNRTYDNHLKPTETADSQGAIYARSYAGDGSLVTATMQYISGTPNGSRLYYDAYGDLTAFTDSYLPPVQGGNCEQLWLSPSYYALSRDGFGRLASLSLPPDEGNFGNAGYYGVVRSRTYDAVTGLLSGETKAQLPSQLNCDPYNVGNLSLTTALRYDQNLRPILKSVTRSDLAGTVPDLPDAVADLALTVTTATKALTNKDLSYSITVKNKSPRFGGRPATGVTLSFVPAGAAAAGLAYTSIPAGCTADGGGLSCTLPDLSGGQQVRLTLKVRPSTTGGLTPTIRARSAALDPNGRNHALTAAAKVCATSTCAPGAGIAYLTDSGTGGSGPVGTAVFAVTYDAASHIAQSTRQDFAGTSLTENFTYDLQTGALVGYANDGGSAVPSTRWPGLMPVNAASYTYDLYGNLTQKVYALIGLSNGGVSVTLAPDADNPFRLASVVENWFDPAGAGGPTATEGFVNGSYTYDIAGNVTADPYGRTYSYDAHGLLGSVTRADGGSQVLLRDGLGHIIQRQATWLADSVLDYGHARSSNHQWQVGLSAGTTYFPDELFFANTQPNTLAVTDLLGRPVNTLTYGTNPAGFGVLANTSYLPEGIATNLIAASAGFPAGIADTTRYPEGAMGTALGIDVGTGLEFKGGYRAYDPAVGRFLQWDWLSPLGRGGLHGYAYAGNDPVNFDDPTGQYREAKTRRYGPKPPHAHHEGFWQGLAAGLKAGAESIYLGPYHWGKTMEQDLAKGNWVGLGKMQAGQDFDSAVRAALGPYSMVFSEFVSTNGSALMSGKDPFKAHVPFTGNSYQIGYQLGDQGASAAEMAVIALITLGAGAALDAAVVEIESLSVDADVVADGAQAGDPMLGSERVAAQAEQISVRSDSSITLFDADDFSDLDSDTPSSDPASSGTGKPDTMKYGDLRQLRMVVEKEQGAMKTWTQGERGKFNDLLNTKYRDPLSSKFEFQGSGRRLDFASAMDSTPKSVYYLKPVEILSHFALEIQESNVGDAQAAPGPNPNDDAASRAPGAASPPVPYQ